MKNLRIYWLAVVALVAGLFVSCDDTDYTAGPEDGGAQVYFASEAASQTFNVGDDESSVSIPVKRIESAEALTVAILSDAGEKQELFDIPESVTFAAGQNAVDLVISFDRTALEDGAEYPIELLINDDNVTAYGRSQIGIKVVPWPWEKLKGTGKFRDDWIAPMFSCPNVEIDVTVHKHKSREGVYMIEEMFGWPYMTAIFGDSQENLSGQFAYTPTNIMIDCSDPNNVIIPQQQSGIVENIYGYGAFIIFTDPDVQGGTIANGIISFPKKAVLMGFGGTGKAYYTNENGMFRIILPGYEAVDYSLAAAYAGMQVDADNVTAKPVLDFTYGADVTGIGYTFVEGDVTAASDEYVAGIVDGTDENAAKVADFEVGAGKVSIAADLTPGIYTLVAVPQDKNEAYLAKSAAVCQFYFPGIGAAEDHSCEVAVRLGKVSENAPEYADQCPEYSSIYWEITGTDIKSGKTYFKPTALIEKVKNGEMAGDGIADLQALMAQYGEDLSADEIAEINEGGAWNIWINLDAATSYTMLVYAENIYGEKALVESEPFTTEALPYTGELKIGDYVMNYTYTDADSGESYPFENVFTIKPTAGSDTNFFVSDFGIEAEIDWYAVYDSAAGTLTLDGVWKGNESSGSFIGSWVGLTATQAVFVASYASEDSKGGDPIVIKVDASTKQPVGLNTDVEVLQGTIVDGKIASYGVYGMYYVDGTTIAPYAEAGTSAAKASVKPTAVRPVDIPFSSVRVPVLSRKTVALRNNFASETSMLVRETSAAVAEGSRTLSVKTAKCEPLPKQLIRKADLNMEASARPLME